MILLLSQKNELFDLIEEQNLSPSQFQFSERISKISPRQWATTLELKDSNFYFSFETGPKSTTKHYAIFSPGESAYTEKQFPGDWNLQLRYFKKWLTYLTREINTPNKWERLSQEIKGIKIKFDNENNDLFTVNEYEDLKQRMNVLKQKVAIIGLAPENVITINEKLDHLTELAKEMNKFDWKGLFVGTIIGVVIQLGVTTDNANLLWEAIREVFNNYILP